MTKAIYRELKKVAPKCPDALYVSESGINPNLHEYAAYFDSGKLECLGRESTPVCDNCPARVSSYSIPTPEGETARVSENKVVHNPRLRG